MQVTISKIYQQLSCNSLITDYREIYIMNIHRQSLVSSSLVSSVRVSPAFSDVHLYYITTLLVIVRQPAAKLWLESCFFFRYEANVLRMP